MRTILLTCAFILLAALQMHATDNTSALWNKGNEWYHQKQYDSAAACFERIAQQKPTNAELYYNLGNAYYRLNKIGPAVLNYERALYFKPDYQEARENLMLTQTRMTNHIQKAQDVFFISWWDEVTMGTKSAMWAIWALVTFLAIVGISMAMYFKITSFRIPGQVPGVLGFIWLCFMVLAYSAALNSKGSGKAVVMQNDAPLLNPEQKSTKPLSLLPEGTTVKVSAVKGDYAEVTLPDGRRGWIQLNWINKI